MINLVLCKRIIPCLDIDKGRVVKGINFKQLRDAGDPVDLASYYSKENADELVFLDITASHEKRDTLVNVVKRVAEKINIPFTVGGGVKSINEANSLLSNGADKVSINTAAVQNPDLIHDLAQTFGRQCVVVAIDVKKNSNKKYFEVFTHGGRKGTDIDAISWAKKVEQLGAGELLITSMDTDGTKQGYDLQLLNFISKKVNIPIIASGGAGKPIHLYDALKIGNADAVLCASIFHYGEYSISEVKNYLKARGVDIRL